jgi:hypothetical protein
VGIYFVTQNPQDIPEAVLAQLGNRVQHALRAYTPSETKAVRIAAESFRPNPGFKTEDMITALGVGEALVSTLDAKGIPTMVERTYIRPPLSQVGPCSPEARTRVISASAMMRWLTAKARLKSSSAKLQNLKPNKPNSNSLSRHAPSPPVKWKRPKTMAGSWA